MNVHAYALGAHGRRALLLQRLEELRDLADRSLLPNRERSLFLTKLEECELWLSRCSLEDRS